MTFQVETLNAVEGFAQIRSDWQALFDRVEGAAWSCAPAVYHSWQSVLRNPTRDKIIVVYDKHKTLRAVFPIAMDKVWRGPSMMPRFDYDPNDKRYLKTSRLRPFRIRQLGVMASLPATMLWLAPLCVQGDRAAVTREIAPEILKLRGWDVGILPSYKGDELDDLKANLESAGAKAICNPLNREVQNLVNLQSFDDVVALQSRKFRQNVRRARKTAQDIDCRFVFYTHPKDISRALPAIAELARKSWKHEGRGDEDILIPYAGAQQAFFEHLLQSPDLNGQPAIGFAETPDGPTAALLLLQMGKSVTALLTFWDGQHNKASPGLLLMGAGIDWAVANRAQHFDFNSTAPWVRHLTDTTQTVSNLVVFRNTIRGQFLHKIASLRGGAK